MTGPVSIEMLWTCGLLRKLVKASFVLGDRLSPHHIAPDVPALFLTCLWIQQKIVNIFVYKIRIMWDPHDRSMDFFLGAIAASLYRENSSNIFQ